MRPGHSTEEPPEIIVDSHRIIAILKNIYQKRGLLSITFPGAAYGYDMGDSLIVEVDEKKNQLLLNKIVPEFVHNRFLKEKKFQARSFIHGIEIKFNGELESLLKEEGDIYYRVNTPEKLSYHQKRGAHRAKTAYFGPLPITLYLDDGSLIEGMIDDISSGGLAITFSSNLSQTQQIGISIPCCRFKLPDNESITCELNIRFIQHHYEDSPPKIGAKFEQLEQLTHRLIMKFVMILDREKRRSSVK